MEAFSVFCHRCLFFKLRFYQLHPIARIFWAKHQVAIEPCLSSGMMFFWLCSAFGGIWLLLNKRVIYLFCHFRVIAVRLHAGEVVLLPYQVGVGSTWHSAICCSYLVSAFYSFPLPTLDVFQLVCDITRLSAIIRCFFQVNIICLGKCVHTHRHTQTPHFFFFMKTLIWHSQTFPERCPPH